MKNKIHFMALLFTFLHVFCKVEASQQPPKKINAAFYGTNYWHTNAVSAPFTSITSFSTAQWTAIRESGAVMIRQGGSNYNSVKQSTALAMPNFGSGSNYEINPAGYVKMVDDMRANGLEPMITVPFRDDGKRSIRAQADTAARIVQLLNVVNKRSVRDFIISNEPGNDQGYYSSGGFSGADDEDVMRIRDYVKEFSVAMKMIFFRN
jgi:hypothetical protein